MKLQNEFRVDVPVERAWEVLTDIPLIAPCMPGATLTGQDGDEYAGKVKIKVGPVTADYSGTAVVVTEDVDARHIEISAKGRDSRGSGNASATILADMVADGEGTKVTIDTDLKISGKVAQFGKGVMGEISEKLIGQFVECVGERVLGEPEPVSGETGGERADARTGAGERAVGQPPAEPVEALDLMDVAGGAMLKRLVPVAAVAALLVLLLVLVRRRS